ncbi:MAG: C40 family peptidase [Cellulophaga sp.]
MFRKLLSLLFLSLFIGCGVYKKKTTYAKERKVTVEASATKEIQPKDSILTIIPATSFTQADAIINTALTYTGVRYKFGGTTKKGMDCSGLLFVSFKKHGASLPRVSIAMAKEGRRIKITKVKKGDLLFFKTRRGKKINHVGLVVSVNKDEIKFVHASSSRGVIVSSLREGFWNYAFVKATRVL